VSNWALSNSWNINSSMHHSIYFKLKIVCCSWRTSYYFETFQTKLKQCLGLIKQSWRFKSTLLFKELIYGFQFGNWIPNSLCIFYHTNNTSEFQVQPGFWCSYITQTRHLTLRRLHLHIETIENLKHFKWFLLISSKFHIFTLCQKVGKVQKMCKYIRQRPAPEYLITYSGKTQLQYLQYLWYL
jgi:hypothetical protein